MHSDMHRIALVLVSLAGLCSSGHLCSANLDDLDPLAIQPASADEAIELTDTIVARTRLTLADLTPENCSRLAEIFGLVVAATDSLAPTKKQLRTLRDRGADLALLCRQLVKSIESQHQDDEYALETFYRSRGWYLMNGAFTTLRYWQAWIDLRIATIVAEPEERLRKLSAAERGFQLTSLRIHYPRIVYGSWLGMAKVEMERHEYQQAERRISMLNEAIAGSQLSDLQAAVDREFRVLKLMQGEDMLAPAEGGALTAEAAKQLWSEAFVLLERQRKEATGAILAGQRLQRVLQSGFVDDQLLTQLMGYRAQIVGTEIGPIGHLVELEYAFDYQKYNTVVLKYREFLAASQSRYSLDLSRYQYHYAVSLYHIELYEDALSVVEDLRVSDGAAATLEPELSKLQFAIAAKLYLHRADSESKRAYLKSARNLIENTKGSPKTDADQARAWAVLARFEQDADLSREYFSNAEELAGSHSDLVILPRYLKLSELFDEAYRENDTKRLNRLAEQGIDLYGDLPASRRKEPEIAALAVQFESLLKDDPLKLSRKIDRLSEQHRDDEAVQRRLFRARFLLAGRESSGLSEYLRNMNPSDTSLWMQDELYKLIFARDKSGDIAELKDLTEWLIPKYSGRPETYRYLQLLRIRSYMHIEQFDIAFRLATDLVTEFPESGDAWKIYAESAQRSGNDFEADRAWARIAGASVEGSPLWLNSAIKRLELQSYESRDSACRLLNKSAHYIARMDAAQYATLEKWNRQLNCKIDEYKGA